MPEGGPDTLTGGSSQARVSDSQAGVSDSLAGMSASRMGQAEVGPLISDLELAVEVKELALEMAEQNLKNSPVFRGNLSDEGISKLQGNNIRRNTGNIDEMYRQCWAVFDHSCSTDANPQHDRCPTGPDTWCWYNRAVLEGGDLWHDHDPNPPNLAPSLKEVWADLCDKKLLGKCVMGATQNRNESSLIWNRCSKTVALYLAVLIFNEGNVPLLPIIEDSGGVEPSQFCHRALCNADARRLYRSLHYYTGIQKRKHQSDRDLRLRLEEQLVEEKAQKLQNRKILYPQIIVYIIEVAIYIQGCSVQQRSLGTLACNESHYVVRQPQELQLQLVL